MIARRRWLAALLNVLQAGWGFLYIGRRGLAAANLIIAPIIAIVFIFSTWTVFLASPLGILVEIVLFLTWVIGVSAVVWRLAAPLKNLARPLWYEHVAFLAAAAVVSWLALDLVHVLADGARAYLPYRTYFAPSWGMWPSIAPGDYFAAGKIQSGQQVHRGEAVMYMKPGNDRELFASRVIAVAGDAVELNGNDLSVNGVVAAAQRRCAAITDDAEDLGSLMIEGPANGPQHFALRSDERGSGYPQNKIVVPNGYVFLLGDNRANAADSRLF